MSDLSIIIPTYGRSENIIRTIKSIDFSKNIEVIVVDDNGKGSVNQKRTEKNIYEWILSGEIVYLPLEENSGACIARNKGVEISNSDYITFLDDDDVLDCNRTIDKLAFFKSNSSYDVCCSDMLVNFGDQNKCREVSFCGVEGKEFLINGKCLTSMIMIKKRSFLSINGFANSPKYQDHIFMLKAHLKDLNVIHFKKTTFIHNQEFGLDRISNNFNEKNLSVRIKYEDLLKEKYSLSKLEEKEIVFRQRLFLLLEKPNYSLRTFYYGFGTFYYVYSARSFLTLSKKILSKLISRRLYIRVREYIWS